MPGRVDYARIKIAAPAVNKISTTRGQNYVFVPLRDGERYFWVGGNLADYGELYTSASDRFYAAACRNRNQFLKILATKIYEKLT